MSDILEIRVQSESFDEGLLFSEFASGFSRIGGVCAFSGLVRDFSSCGDVSGIILEHYSGMAERQLGIIGEDAISRYGLERLLIVHRYGELLAGDKIVLVIAGSCHRKQAFEGCEYVMDYLKSFAPFWKYEVGVGGDRSEVKVSESDILEYRRWQTIG